MPIYGGNKPEDYLNLLIDIVVLESIVREANAYAENFSFYPRTTLEIRIKFVEGFDSRRI